MTPTKFEPSWQAFDGIFGGYVIGRLMQAAEIEGYLPLSISVQFMGAVRPGTADLHADVTHRGTLTAAVDLAIVQQHRRASAVVKLGRQPDERIIDQRIDLTEVPRPEGLQRAVVPYEPYPYERALDTRQVATPGSDGVGRTSAWIRLDPAVTSMGAFVIACMFLDALPPGLFFLDPAPAFVPTVDFTAHFAPPVEWSVGDWMFLTGNTLWATRDFCLEQASLYTPTGRLVAQARQTRGVRWAKGHQHSDEHEHCGRRRICDAPAGPR